MLYITIISVVCAAVASIGTLALGCTSGISNITSLRHADHIYNKTLGNRKFFRDYGKNWESSRKSFSQFEGSYGKKLDKHSGKKIRDRNEIRKEHSRRKVDVRRGEWKSLGISSEPLAVRGKNGAEERKDARHIGTSKNGIKREKTNLNDVAADAEIDMNKRIEKLARETSMHDSEEAGAAGNEEEEGEEEEEEDEGDDEKNEEDTLTSPIADPVDLTPTPLVEAQVSFAGLGKAPRDTAFVEDFSGRSRRWRRRRRRRRRRSDWGRVAAANATWIDERFRSRLRQGRAGFLNDRRTYFKKRKRKRRRRKHFPRREAFDGRRNRVGSEFLRRLHRPGALNRLVGGGNEHAGGGATHGTEPPLPKSEPTTSDTLARGELAKTQNPYQRKLNELCNDAIKLVNESSGPVPVQTTTGVRTVSQNVLTTLLPTETTPRLSSVETTTAAATELTHYEGVFERKMKEFHAQQKSKNMSSNSRDVNLMKPFETTIGTVSTTQLQTRMATETPKASSTTEKCAESNATLDATPAVSTTTSAPSSSSSSPASLPPISSSNAFTYALPNGGDLSPERYLKIRHALRNYLIRTNVWSPHHRRIYWGRRKRCNKPNCPYHNKCKKGPPMVCLPFVKRGQDDMLKFLIHVMQNMLEKSCNSKKPYPLDKLKFKASKQVDSWEMADSEVSTCGSSTTTVSGKTSPTPCPCPPQLAIFPLPLPFPPVPSQYYQSPPPVTPSMSASCSPRYPQYSAPPAAAPHPPSYSYQSPPSGSFTPYSTMAPASHPPSCPCSSMVHTSHSPSCPCSSMAPPPPTTPPSYSYQPSPAPTYPVSSTPSCLPAAPMTQVGSTLSFTQQILIIPTPRTPQLEPPTPVPTPPPVPPPCPTCPVEVSKPPPRPPAPIPLCVSTETPLPPCPPESQQLPLEVAPLPSQAPYPPDVICSIPRPPPCPPDMGPGPPPGLSDVAPGPPPPPPPPDMTPNLLQCTPEVPRPQIPETPIEPSAKSLPTLSFQLVCPPVATLSTTETTAVPLPELSFLPDTTRAKEGMHESLASGTPTTPTSSSTDPVPSTTMQSTTDPTSSSACHCPPETVKASSSSSEASSTTSHASSSSSTATTPSSHTSVVAVPTTACSPETQSETSLPECTPDYMTPAPSLPTDADFPIPEIHVFDYVSQPLSSIPGNRYLSVNTGSQPESPPSSQFSAVGTQAQSSVPGGPESSVPSSQPSSSASGTPQSSASGSLCPCSVSGTAQTSVPSSQPSSSECVVLQSSVPSSQSPSSVSDMPQSSVPSPQPPSSECVVLQFSAPGSPSPSSVSALPESPVPGSQPSSSECVVPQSSGSPAPSSVSGTPQSSVPGSKSPSSEPGVSQSSAPGSKLPSSESGMPQSSVPGSPCPSSECEVPQSSASGSPSPSSIPGPKLLSSESGVPQSSSPGSSSQSSASGTAPSPASGSLSSFSVSDVPQSSITGSKRPSSEPGLSQSSAPGSKLPSSEPGMLQSSVPGSKPPPSEPGMSQSSVSGSPSPSSVSGLPQSLIPGSKAPSSEPGLSQSSAPGSKLPSSEPGLSQASASGSPSPSSVSGAPQSSVSGSQPPSSECVVLLVPAPGSPSSSSVSKLPQSSAPGSRPLSSEPGVPQSPFPSSVSGLPQSSIPGLKLLASEVPQSPAPGAQFSSSDSVAPQSPLHASHPIYSLAGSLYLSSSKGSPPPSPGPVIPQPSVPESQPQSSVPGSAPLSPVPEVPQSSVPGSQSQSLSSMSQSPTTVSPPESVTYSEIQCVCIPGVPGPLPSPQVPESQVMSSIPGTMYQSAETKPQPPSQALPEGSPSQQPPPWGPPLPEEPQSQVQSLGPKSQSWASPSPEIPGGYQSQSPLTVSEGSQSPPWRGSYPTIGSGSQSQVPDKGSSLSPSPKPLSISLLMPPPKPSPSESQSIPSSGSVRPGGYWSPASAAASSAGGLALPQTAGGSSSPPFTGGLSSASAPGLVPSSPLKPPLQPEVGPSSATQSETVPSAAPGGPPLCACPPSGHSPPLTPISSSSGSVPVSSSDVASSAVPNANQCLDKTSQGFPKQLFAKPILPIFPFTPEGFPNMPPCPTLPPDILGGLPPLLPRLEIRHGALPPPLSPLEPEPPLFPPSMDTPSEPNPFRSPAHTETYPSVPNSSQDAKSVLRPLSLSPETPGREAGSLETEGTPPSQQSSKPSATPSPSSPPAAASLPLPPCPTPVPNPRESSSCIGNDQNFLATMVIPTFFPPWPTTRGDANFEPFITPEPCPTQRMGNRFPLDRLPPWPTPPSFLRPSPKPEYRNVKFHRPNPHLIVASHNDQRAPLELINFQEGTFPKDPLRRPNLKFNRIDFESVYNMPEEESVEQAEINIRKQLAGQDSLRRNLDKMAYDKNFATRINDGATPQTMDGEVIGGNYEYPNYSYERLLRKKPVKRVKNRYNRRSKYERRRHGKRYLPARRKRDDTSKGDTTEEETTGEESKQEETTPATTTSTTSTAEPSTTTDAPSEATEKPTTTPCVDAEDNKSSNSSSSDDKDNSDQRDREQCDSFAQEKDAAEDPQKPTTLKSAAIVRGPRRSTIHPPAKVFAKVFPESFVDSPGESSTVKGGGEKTTTPIPSSNSCSMMHLKLLAVCEGYLEMIKLLKLNNQTSSEDFDNELIRYCENEISKNFENHPDSPTEKKSTAMTTAEPSTTSTTTTTAAPTTEEATESAKPECSLSKRNLQRRVEHLGPILREGIRPRYFLPPASKNDDWRRRRRRRRMRHRGWRRRPQRGRSEPYSDADSVRLLRQKKGALMSWLLGGRKKNGVSDTPRETGRYAGQKAMLRRGRASTAATNKPLLKGYKDPNNGLETEYIVDDVPGRDGMLENDNAAADPSVRRKGPRRGGKLTSTTAETAYPMYAKMYGYDKGGELSEVEILVRRVNERNETKEELKNITVLAVLNPSGSDEYGDADASNSEEDAKRFGRGNATSDDEEGAALEVGARDNGSFSLEEYGDPDVVNEMIEETETTLSEVEETESPVATKATSKTTRSEPRTKTARAAKTTTTTTPRPEALFEGGSPHKNHSGNAMSRTKEWVKDYTIEFLNYAVYIIPIMFIMLFLICCVCLIMKLMTRHVKKKYKVNKKTEKRKRRKRRASQSPPPPSSSESDTETTASSLVAADAKAKEVEEREEKKGKKKTKKKKKKKKEGFKHRGIRLWTVIKSPRKKDDSEVEAEEEQEEEEEEEEEEAGGDTEDTDEAKKKVAAKEEKKKDKKRVKDKNFLRFLRKEKQKKGQEQSNDAEESHPEEDKEEEEEEEEEEQEVEEKKKLLPEKKKPEKAIQEDSGSETNAEKPEDAAALQRERDSAARERRELIALLEELKNLEDEQAAAASKDKKEYKSVFVQYMTQEEERAEERERPRCRRSEDAGRRSYDVFQDVTEEELSLTEMTDLQRRGTGYHETRYSDGMADTRFERRAALTIDLAEVDREESSGDEELVLERFRRMSSDLSAELLKGTARDIAHKFDMLSRMFDRLPCKSVSPKRRSILMEELENFRKQLGCKKYIRLKDDGVLCRLQQLR